MFDKMHSGIDTSLQHKAVRVLFRNTKLHFLLGELASSLG